MDRRIFIAAGAVAAVGGAYAINRNLSSGPSDLLVGMANAQETTAPSDITDMVMGSADAPVEMIEYASYTCPHCARFHAAVWPQLKADYVDTGKVRFVYREVYFDRFGLWASMLARCGGEAKFFGITDIIYEKQREWTASGDPAQIVGELRKIGKLAGLDDATLDACMQDAAMAQGLVNWYEENAQRDGVQSTPSFLINGTKYSNMGYDEMKTILDEQIAG